MSDRNDNNEQDETCKPIVKERRGERKQGRFHLHGRTGKEDEVESVPALLIEQACIFFAAA